VLKGGGVLGPYLTEDLSWKCMYITGKSTHQLTFDQV